MTILNVAVAIIGIVTGPLQARALGADGRGELAAILVPITLAPWLFGLALGSYAQREVASGRRSVNELLGSLGVPLLLMTAIGMLAAVPVARLLADGNDTIETFIIIGLLLLPVSQFNTLLNFLMLGLERWNLVILMRAIPVVVSLVGVVVMYALGEMTVPRVVILTLAGGTLAMLPALAVVARAGRPVFRRATARASVSFGLRTWVGAFAYLANSRLDQLLMITMVSDRELGLYVVAVTLSTLSSFVTVGLIPPLVTRVAQSETALVPRALRMVLAGVISMNLAIAAVTPFVLPAAFGAEFKDAVDQALVLLAAGIPLGGIAVLSSALTADGAPGRSSIGEAIALAITLPGLFLLVPAYGGLGAALVSLVAYSASFAYQLYVTRRRLGGSLGSYLVPGGEDARWAMALVLRRG